MDLGAAPTDKGVPQALSRLLGAKPAMLRRLTTGYSSSRTYLVETDGPPVVVKVNDDPRTLASTARNMAELAELGIPVPTVLAYDDSQRDVPGAMLVMSRVPGRDLRYELPTMTGPQMTTLAEQIVEFQRRAATIPPVGHGCGHVGVGEPAERSWIDVVRRPDDHTYADPLPNDAIDLVARLHEAIDLAAPHLSAVRPTCFLDDLTTKNVMIHNGALSGVVDFDCVAFGDPLFHLGLTAAAVTADVPPRCRFYVDELIRLSDAADGIRRCMVDLYEAVFLVRFLAAEMPYDDGDWRRPAAATARRHLRAVEGFFTGEVPTAP